MSDTDVAVTLNVVLSLVAVLFIRLSKDVMADGTRPPKESIVAAKMILTVGMCAWFAVIVNFVYTIIITF